MSVTVAGYFGPTHIGRRSAALVPVPLISAFLWLPGIDTQPAFVRFLIDTGADMTVLHPPDSTRLFSPQQWGMIRSAQQRRVGGAGHGLPHYLVDAFAFLTRDDSEVELEPLTIWIAEPDPLNIDQESLLGRDVLQHFVTTFDEVDSITLRRRDAPV